MGLVAVSVYQVYIRSLSDRAAAAQYAAGFESQSSILNWNGHRILHSRDVAAGRQVLLQQPATAGSYGDFGIGQPSERPRRCDRSAFLGL